MYTYRFVLESSVTLLHLSSSVGKFQYKPNMVKSFGMLAGGTGITPMYQIICAVLDNPKGSTQSLFFHSFAVRSLRMIFFLSFLSKDKTKIDLLFGNLTEEDILLRDELNALIAKHPSRFTVYHVLNHVLHIF